MNNIELERLMAKYPKLSELDIHYLSMKYHGVNDANTNQGRPTWNLSDDKSLYHITFGTSEEDSPYVIQEDQLLWNNSCFQFQVGFVERVPVVHGRYYYFRHPDFLTPTLDDQFILNFNFQRQCNVCTFCQFQLYADKPNITPRRGFNLMLSRGDVNDLSHLAEIAVVTGLFGSSERVANHLLQIIDIASELNFKGGLFYMGFELDDPIDIRHIFKRLEETGLSYFRMAYTLESFARRDELMHGRKGKNTLDEIYGKLKIFRDGGIKRLEYAYIPGLDQLEVFYKGAETLVSLARPHLCVFRPWKSGQRVTLSCNDYFQMKTEYLCKIRNFYEELYGGPILGNNLGNLWPFPANRISQKWFSKKIVGPIIGRRWWEGGSDLRALDTQIVSDFTGGK